jgi:hypothetical protein
MVPSPPEIEEARVRSFVDGQMDRVRKSLALIGPDLGYQASLLNVELADLTSDVLRARMGVPCKNFPAEFHAAYGSALRAEVDALSDKINEGLRLARAI